MMMKMKNKMYRYLPIKHPMKPRLKHHRLPQVNHQLALLGDEAADLQVFLCSPLKDMVGLA